VESLTIVTNKRKSNKYGGDGGVKTYYVHGSGGEVIGFFGRWGRYLDQIGIFVPKNVSLWNNQAWLLANCPNPNLREPGRALELAKKAVELDPAQGMFWNTLGVAHYRAGDWNAATAALKKSDELLKGNELSVNAFFLAMAHWRLSNKPEARKWYDQAVGWMEKNKPQDEELQRFRAEAEALLGSNKTSKPSMPKTQKKEDKSAQ
jgi:tetratricopeptide (TPR) repeat protein